METIAKPIQMPLEASINRCLGHGHQVGEWCEKRYQCACHETIKHDLGINPPVAYRKCWTESWAGFIPMDGFKDVC